MATPTNTAQLKTAIAESRRLNKIVDVEVVAEDVSEVLAELNAVWEGEVDDARLDGTTYDVWGWTDQTADGEQDWRLHVTVGPNRDSVAYNTGYEAAREGESRSACPYESRTVDARWWLAGWDDAQ